MNFLHKKLQSDIKKRGKLKSSTYNGFSFREIADFEDAIIEVHSLCRKEFEKTKNMEYANVALECLKAISDMEKIKSQIILKY